MGIEQDLRNEKVAHLDLSHFALVRSGTPVSVVLDTMRQKRVSAVLVDDGAGQLTGIFTERDALMKVVDEPGTWAEAVDAYMTADPETVSLDEPVTRAIQIINARHYRHVPVLDAQGGIVGNVSHHCLIKFLTDRFPREVYNLPPDPEQIPKTPEGA